MLMTSATTINAWHPSPDECLRWHMRARLNAVISAAWEKLVEEIAASYASRPPLYRDGDEWYYTLGDMEKRVCNSLLPVAQAEADKLYRECELHLHPDAAKWRRWLAKETKAKCQWHAYKADYSVAQRMCACFSERYGIRFFYCPYEGRVAFIASNPAALGHEWEILRVAGVHGRATSDFEYLREVYAYNSSKRLLVCLHNKYIIIPSGNRVLEWVLVGEWWSATPEEAKAIAASAAPFAWK